jgi:hypothetical protein
MSLSIIFFLQRRYRRLRPKLFCRFLHKSCRDGTTGRLVFRHVHTKTRNPNFSTPENTKIEFASSRIDWSGNAGWLRMGMRSLSLVAWPVNPVRSKLNFMIRDRDPYSYFYACIGATFGRTPQKARSAMSQNIHSTTLTCIRHWRYSLNFWQKFLLNPVNLWKWDRVPYEIVIFRPEVRVMNNAYM